MQKTNNRTLTIALVLFLLVSCIVPVSAAENATGNWIELLDYGTVNSSGTNVFGITGSKVITLQFPTGSKAVGHVNVLLYSSQVITDAYVQDSNGTVHSFNVYPVGQGLYRIFGDLNQYIYSSLNLSLETNSSSTAYCELLSCRITTVIFNRKQVPAHLQGMIYKTYPMSVSLSYPATASSDNFVNWAYSGANDYVSSGYNGLFQFYLYLDDWEEYDFIDIEITGYWKYLTSVYAMLNDLVIPTEVSYISSSNGVGNGVVLTLDLRDLDRRYTGSPVVTFKGNGFQNNDSETNHNQFLIDSIFGYIQENDPDPLGYWMRNVKQHLTSLFNNLGSSITSLGFSIESWITTQTTSIQSALGVMRQNLVNGIGGFITDFSTNVNNWISSQTQSINFAINSTRQAIINGFSDLTDDVGTFLASQTNRVITSISDAAESIIEALSPDPDTSQLENEVDNIKQDMENATDIMGELSKPNTDHVFTDVQIDVGTGSAIGDMMGAFFQNDLIYSVVFGSLTFLLFGVIVG